jgi:hypothetical protein
VTALTQGRPVRPALKVRHAPDLIGKVNSHRFIGQKGIAANRSTVD